VPRAGRGDRADAESEVDAASPPPCLRASDLVSLCKVSRGAERRHS